MRSVTIELKKTKVDKGIFNQLQTYNATQTSLIPIGWVIHDTQEYFVAHDGEGIIYKRKIFKPFSYEARRFMKEGESCIEYYLINEGESWGRFEDKEKIFDTIGELNEYRDKFFELGQFYL